MLKRTKLERAKDQLYPKGSARPQHVEYIEQYESNRREKPLTSEQWNRVETELARFKKMAALPMFAAKHTKATEELLTHRERHRKEHHLKIEKYINHSWSTRINNHPVTITIHKSGGSEILFSLKHPLWPNAKASIMIDLEAMRKGVPLGKALSSETVGNEFEKYYGDGLGALEQVLANIK